GKGEPRHREEERRPLGPEAARVEEELPRPRTRGLHARDPPLASTELAPALLGRRRRGGIPAPVLEVPGPGAEATRGAAVLAGPQRGRGVQDPHPIARREEQAGDAIRGELHGNGHRLAAAPETDSHP